METPKVYLYSRFSSASQEDGDSLNRQLTQAKHYAESNGLILDESLNLQDKGISAFRGKNKSQGSLGLFLSLVKAGKIEKGSVLLAESMDRISREQPGDALFQFLNLIYSDITIITTEDDTVYNR
jgi:DNA invertase Pin-like site-specific DNA recombinase